MNYWKLRALLTQVQLLEERAQLLFNQAQDVKQSSLKEAGLDPNKNYALNDKEESVSEVNQNA